jgi:predicted Mrr-cat superfamily restriction endonuclease
MNYSTAVFLINDAARAVYATYEADDKTAPKTLFKTFDKTIAVGDYVVVPTNTRHKMTVCKIIEVDVDFDLGTTDELAWVIGKVDKAMFQKTLDQEAVAIAAIKSAELRKKREELRTALFADHAAKLAELDIAHAGNGGVLEAPKTDAATG